MANRLEVEMNDKAEQSVTGALPERDTTKTAEQQGLFRKFEVHRVDGSDQIGGKHHGCRYYVLDVDHDPYAAAALGAYADACKESHPELARDLREKWGAADTIDNLRAQLAEAQRDSERLDWMTEQCAYIVSAPECCDGYWLNYPRKDGTLWTQATEHETPRAAIDAAKGKSNA